MESRVGACAMPTDHEPGRIPGGETPPSTAGGTPAATDARFMESSLFKNDLLTAHEPWSEDDRERPSPQPSPASGRGRKRSVVFEGLGLGLAGIEGDGLCGEAWPSRRVSYATPSPLGEGWGEGLADRFMGSRLFEIDLPTDHEPEKAEGGLRLRTRVRLRLRGEPRFMEIRLFEIDLLTSMNLAG